MSTNPKPASEDADKKKEEEKALRKAGKLAGRGLWLLAFATVIFNKELRKGSGKTLFGLNIVAERIKGLLGDELIQAVGVAWTLIEFRWVGLALMNLGLYWFFPIWGPIHVISNLLFFILVEHFANKWMVQRIMTVLQLSAGIGFVSGLDKTSWKGFWTSLGTALARSGQEMGYNTWELIHKIANEGMYFAFATFICAFGMFGATGMPWATIPAASIAAYILWKISTSIGNNKTAEGDAVVSKEQYDAIRRKRDDKGLITWEPVKGHKFALPRFQSGLQTAMSTVIALSVLLSWGAAFVYRSDADRDGLSNYEERVVYKTDWQRGDTDKDQISDAEEIARKLDPTRRVETDPLAQTSAQQYRRDQFVADSLRQLYSNPLNWGKVIPKGEVGPFSVRYSTPDSMPTQGVSQATINFQNWTDAMMRNSHGTGSSLVDFMVRLGAVLFLVWLGAKFLAGIWRILAFLAAAYFLVVASGLIWIVAWPLALLVAWWFFARFKPVAGSSSSAPTPAEAHGH